MGAVFHILNPQPYPRLLSLVIPVYNEQESVGLLRGAITDLLTKIPCRTEVILVNDGSSDNTLQQLVQWANSDQRIKILGLARNFGHQAAVTAGLDAAMGDAVVIMDADLQDPPHVVLEMLEKYRQGYDVAYGQRIERGGESTMKRLTAWGFYRFMRAFVHKDLPADAGDFRLMSRKVVDSLGRMRETHRFLRGMVAWVGFAQIGVPFKRPPRAAGTTKYPMRRMLKFAWTATCSFSIAPLRLSLYAGVLVGVMGLGIALWAVIDEFLGHTVAGWSSLMAVVCLVGGAILFNIGMLGEYVGRLFEQTKDRPLYFVSTRTNFDESAQIPARRDEATVNGDVRLAADPRGQDSDAPPAVRNAS